MCYPLTVSNTARIIYFFKAIEWFFLFWIIWVAIHLMFTRYFFDGAIKCVNWLIKIHGFEGAIVGTEKAFRQFRRDLWILLILNILIIVLIKLL